VLGSHDHVVQAERFEAFLRILPAGHPYREWVVVVWFYIALHYVEAFLVIHRRARRDHTTRRDEMRAHQETKAILTDYHQLEKASQEARYEGTPFTNLDLTALEPKYIAVRKAMRSALGLQP
jgi:hypothetical protein